MSKRTERIQFSPEGRVLRHLRTRHGLSMRKAGELVGVSDSYISLVENGRANPPNRATLEKFLNVYGGIGSKYFYELCRDWREDSSDIEVIRDLLPKLKEAEIKSVRTLVEHLVR